MPDTPNPDLATPRLPRRQSNMAYLIATRLANVAAMSPEQGGNKLPSQLARERWINPSGGYLWPPCRTSLLDTPNEGTKRTGSQQRTPAKTTNQRPSTTSRTPIPRTASGQRLEPREVNKACADMALTNRNKPGQALENHKQKESMLDPLNCKSDHLPSSPTLSLRTQPIMVRSFQQ